MTVRVQITFPETLSGVGADLVQNTWHANPVSATTALDAANAFISALNGFYINIASVYSELINGNGNVKAYDLTDPEPRAPIVDEAFDIGDITNPNCLPPELAVCLSFRAVYSSGQPKGRRRGRVFIGPMNTGVNDNVNGRVDDTEQALIKDTAEGLRVDSDASSEFTWVVYSPTDAVGRAVVGGWVDDAWDIQRRRGLELTTRAQFGVGH